MNIYLKIKNKYYKWTEEDYNQKVELAKTNETIKLKLLEIDEMSREDDTNYKAFKQAYERQEKEGEMERKQRENKEEIKRINKLNISGLEKMKRVKKILF